MTSRFESLTRRVSAYKELVLTDCHKGSADVHLAEDVCQPTCRAYNQHPHP